MAPVKTSVWYIKDDYTVVNWNTDIIANVAQSRIRRAVLNYAYTGYSPAIYLFARPNERLSAAAITRAKAEASTDPLPASIGSPPPSPTAPPRPPESYVPIPDGPAPASPAIVVWNPTSRRWMWVTVTLTGGGDTFPSAGTFPGATTFPG